MISTTIKTFIQADLASVWHSVTSLYDYSWRSDIKDIEVSDERHFKVKAFLEIFIPYG